jgi:DNA helicase-2/ATP-dependent DNA helicase PcrA
VRDILRSAGWTPTAPEGRGASRERWDALQALVSLADAIAAAPPTGSPPTVADLVAELDERAAAQHAPAVDGVTLASLHAAKGLEWEAVFLVGLSEGLLPTVQAQTAAAVAEERRLLYVGITRAREHLELSYSRARHPRARASRNVSRFLTDLWPGERRSVKVPTAEPDEQVVQSLTRWRDARAAELCRQPGSLLTTATIRAIAERRPSTLEELGQVRGVGPKLLADVGEQVLEALRAPVL